MLARRTFIARWLGLIVVLLGLAAPAAHATDMSSSGQNWAVSSPEAEGVSSAKLAQMIETLRADHVPVHAIVLVRHGQLALDASFFPYRHGEPHDLASVTKSFTSTLVGIAIDKGVFTSVAEPVTDIFPEARDPADPRKQRMTLESLLEMRSGLHCIKTPELGEKTLLEMLTKPDWVRYTLSLPMADEPGSRFVYCSSGMHLLSGAISQATGRNELAFGEDNLFKPLGIPKPAWPTDPQGRNTGFGSLQLRPTDMAKLGYLFLEGGVWKGRRIVSKRWVEAATHGHPAGGPYGYGWWIGHDFAPFAYAADGRGSQAIAVDPARDLVVVVSAGISDQKDADETKHLILGSIVSDAALPPDPAGQARLSAALRLAASPPPAKAVTKLPPAAAAISGHSLVLGPNLFGLTSLTLDFAGERQAKAEIAYSGILARWLLDPLDVSPSKSTGWRPLGLDGVPRLSRAPGHGFLVALDGAWTDDHTFAFRYDTVAGINKLMVTVSIVGDGAEVTIEEPTLRSKETIHARIAPGGRARGA